MKKLMIGGVVGLSIIVLVAVAAMAGPGWRCNGTGSCGGGCGAGGMHDPAQAEVMQGQVVSVERIESRRGPKGVVLTVNAGSESRAVHLGPRWYLERQNVQIAAGDLVEIKGANTTRRGKNVFLAAEVKKGSEVLILRDENGVPAWAGSRCRQGA